MKYRSIDLRQHEVRGILAGRQTQIRRVLKPQPSPELLADYADIRTRYGSNVTDGQMIADCFPCRFGQPGDRLWGRETFSGPHCMDASSGTAAVPPAKWGESSRIWYWADGNPDEGDWTRPRPSILMPRWASRITLEITGVRVERLQDISEADAIAEGIQELIDAGVDHDGTPRDTFRKLWESINGPGSWDANPWVWVVEFKRIESGAAQ